MCKLGTKLKTSKDGVVPITRFECDTSTYVFFFFLLEDKEFSTFCITFSVKSKTRETSDKLKNKKKLQQEHQGQLKSYYSS